MSKKSKQGKPTMFAASGNKGRPEVNEHNHEGMAITVKNQQLKVFFTWATLITFAALVLYYVIFDPLLDYVYLKIDSAYTPSNTISIGTPNKAGNQSKYTFYLNGRWYSGFTSLPLKMDGTKYFIKFYPKNPNRNRATTVQATDYDIKNMPPGGYKNLPHE